MKKINMNRKVLLQVLMTALLLLGIGSKSYAQFLVNENFRSKEVGNNIVLGTGYNNYKAYLTAATKKNGNYIDNDNEGWLRLTEAAQNRSGYAFIDEAFPSERGVFIDFEYKAWGGTHADGVSVFLFDGTIDRDEFRVGGYGGSLSYAPRDLKYTPASRKNPEKWEGIKGLKGGYIGLGIDEFGNFASTSEGKDGISGGRSNAFTLRGHTIETATTGTDTNKMLHSVSAPSGTRIDYASSTSTRPTDSQYYRRVQIEMNKNTTTGKYDIAVRWATTVGGQFTDVFTYSYDQVPPALFKLGFGASTGGNTNYHEIRNLFATTPGGVLIEKTANKSLVNEGEELTYTINLKGQNGQAFDFKFTDDFSTISEFFEVTSISYDAFGNTVTIPAGNKDGNVIKNLKDVQVTLGRLGTVTFTVKGKVKKAPVGNILINKAAIDRASLERALDAGKIGFIDDTKIKAEAKTVVVDSNYCGCPPDAEQLQSSTSNVTLQSGTIYCVTGEVSVKDLIVENNAYLYVNEGARLRVTGTYTQKGGIVSICPKGGVDVTGSANFGVYGSQNDAKLILKKNAFFTVQGSLAQGDPSQGGYYPKGKATIEMDDSSFVEVCGTFTQQATTYPLVNFTGQGRRNAYFIMKAQASGGQNSVLADNSNKVNVIAMHTVTNLLIGSTNYCGPNARKQTCSFWPEGLTENINGVPGGCHEAEGILDKPAFEITKKGTFKGTVPVKVGDKIEYTLVVKNTGNVELYNLEIDDPKLDLHRVVNFLDLDQTATFTATYSVTQSDIERGGVFNQANGKVVSDGRTVTVTSIDPNPLAPNDPNYPLPDPAYPNCDTCTVTPLIQSPKITLVKTGVFDDEVEGTGNGVITYTFMVKNTGNVSLSAVKITDDLLGDGYTLVHSQNNQDKIEVGASWTVTAIYNVTDRDIDAEKVTNQAKAVGKSPKQVEVEALSGTELGNTNPTITPVEGGGPLITNPHIYHKVQ